MKRHIIAQMRNEWKSNVWLLVELVIVGCIMWYLLSTVLYFQSQRMADRGYDLRNIYVADVRWVPEDSELYQAYADSAHSYFTDLQLLLANLAANPYVEKIGYGCNMLPYNYNYYGCAISSQWGDSVVSYQANSRRVSPEVMEVYRIKGNNGETPAQLADIIRRGEFILSEADENFRGTHMANEFVGKSVWTTDTARQWIVGAVAAGLRRTDFEPLYSGVLYSPLGDKWPNNLAIRVKDGCMDAFGASLKAGDKQVGNAYLSNLQPLDKMKDIAHLEINTMIRNYYICTTFLLLVIFLSFLGTFWFRTQQREGEIAIRIVNGATRRDVMRRLLSEGLGLLAVATVVSAVVDALLYTYVLADEYEATSVPMSIICLAAVVACVLMAVLVVAGIWPAARKAMNSNPAYALKEQ